MSDAAVYTSELSPLRPFAESVGWLWRLPLSGAPAAGAVGFGSLEEAPELERLLRDGALAGAVVFGARPGPDVGRVPGRRRLTGTARFDSGAATQGEFSVLHGGGTPVAASSLGVHALRDETLLTMALDPLSSWGTVQHFWALPVLARFLGEMLGREPAMLPPIGVIRYDDVPGTAAQQLTGAAKGDARVERRLKRVLAACERAGAVLNAAVACRALDGEREIPLDAAWPRSVALLRDAIAEGTAEQVCHGYLHLDRERSRPDAPEPREFAHLDRSEAGRRIEAALEWAEGALGRRPPTFVAPNWAYSEGTIEALAGAGLPGWLPFRFGPLVEGPNARETLVSTVNGLEGLDYSPLAVLAANGLPPYVIIHGGLIDARFDGLRGARHLPALARLALRRDLLRLPSVEGVRWVGAGELLSALRAHDRAEVPARAPSAPR